MTARFVTSRRFRAAFSQSQRAPRRHPPPLRRHPPPLRRRRSRPSPFFPGGCPPPHLQPLRPERPTPRVQHRPPLPRPTSPQNQRRARPGKGCTKTTRFADIGVSVAIRRCRPAAPTRLFSWPQRRRKQHPAPSALPARALVGSIRQRGGELGCSDDSGLAREDFFGEDLDPSPRARCAGVRR